MESPAMPREERARIVALMNREVVPAIGCTEPIAVALCTARAAETLGVRPERIDVRLSANILKNAMGVGIPGTGMIGLPIAVALGALVGRSEYRLEVLRDVTPEATMDACDRNVPGIAEAMRAHSLAITPYAMLSRALCMQRGRHLVINLPGSEKAARENWDGVVKALPHAVKMMAGGGH